MNHGIGQGRTAATTTTHCSELRAVCPKMIVFDLDNTLWTPELYQLRKLQRNNQFPVANKDVKLYPAAAKIIEEIRQGKNSTFANTKFAIASRTKSVEWAHDLLEQFGIKDWFDYIEIFSGDKKRHFANLNRDSGIEFGDMLFFDDNRDGKYGNCEPVASLGVLSVHCPSGINEESVWETALARYGDWAGEGGSPPNTIVEWDGSITTTKPIDPHERFTGTVKYINEQQRFGFIQYGDRKTKDTFFHFSALPFVDSVVEEGDELTFSVVYDKRKGKDAASNIEIVSSSGSSGDNTDTVTMNVFSMNLPFAALLSNGYKTLETRNGTMFVPYEEGTKMLLHVGQRTYPDANRHLEVMKSGGLNDEKIRELKSLPEGFGKGMAVAIVELGKTYETTLEERCDPDFQRSVGAFGADSGMRATEIKRVEYLKQGIKVSGQGGIFKAKIDRDVFPDGWLDDRLE
jgi:magnesium-dependent phosphatase 1